jgi:hypothetical protein
MTDAFTEFFDKHPPTHINGSKQIDLISVSQRLVPYIDRAFILSPKESEGDHSTIGIDLTLELLLRMEISQKYTQVMLKTAI